MANALTQNPLDCPSCGGWPVGLCPCWGAAEHVPTQHIPEPPTPKCECGSGTHTWSGAHSHWCPLWVSA